MALVLPVALVLASCTDGLDQSQVPSVGGSGPGTSSYARQRWLELPETSPLDSYDFFCRQYRLGGSMLRNYSFYWNYDDRVSMWVAYPLSRAYLGSSKRTDAWGYDPLLPAARQQNVSGGYIKGNNPVIFYTRGAQLPSTHRTASQELNATTFYGTNMTPQSDDFSSGIWATLGYEDFLAAGFWFEHRNYSNTLDVKAQAVSVSELETRLGYSLFVNLPDRVSSYAVQQIKTENPANVKWWWQ